MHKLITIVKDAPYRLAAVAAAGSLVATQAHAQGNGVGDIAKNVDTQLAGVGNLVIAGSFLVGVGLCAAGLLKLKAAADSGGQQVKYGEGLWRLGVGAGLVALPAVTGVGVNTFFGGGATTAPTMETATFTN